MDIHVNAWAAKCMVTDTGNVKVQVREIDTKDKIIIHMSTAMAKQLCAEISRLLSMQAGAANEGG